VSPTVRFLCCLAIPLAASFATPAGAQSGEQGSACIHDFAPGVACDTSSDVKVVAVTPIEILDGCTSENDTATLTVDVTLSSAGAPDRYDVGFYVALNGNSALSGASCYHDYLSPPLTTMPSYPIHNGPWANLEPFDPNDSCGDMQSGTEVTKSIRTPLLPIQIACTDTNHDGTVDVSACASWRVGTGAPQGTCDGLRAAVPNSNDRCSCGRVEVLPEPRTAYSLAPAALLLGALGARRRRA
jgi:hypothetical protein